MGRKHYLILMIAITPLLLVYNNCSRSTGDLSGSGIASSIGGDLGALGFAGELTLESFSSNPQCAEEVAGATAQIQLNGDVGSARLQWLTCDEQGDQDIPFSEVQRKSYDVHLAYFEGRVYASPQLHEGVEDYFYYQEFCFNESKQLDFTIQYLVEDPMQPNSARDWTGITLRGPESALPGLQFNGGFLEVDDDSRIFTADNDLYQVEIFEEYAPGQRRALMSLRSGETINLDCLSEQQD